MTQKFSNENRGSIWKNEKKETESHPDFTGSLNVNGVEYWVSAWKRKPDASEKAPALSFSVKPKEDQRLAPAPQQARQQPQQSRKSNHAGFENMDDDLPF